MLHTNLVILLIDEIRINVNGLYVVRLFWKTCILHVDGSGCLFCFCFSELLRKRWGLHPAGSTRPMEVAPGCSCWFEE